MNFFWLIVLLLSLAAFVVAMTNKTLTQQMYFTMVSASILLGIVSLIGMLSSISSTKSNFKYVNKHGYDYQGYDKYIDPEEEEGYR